MVMDTKSPTTIGAGHGKGGMLLQVETVWNLLNQKFTGLKFMGSYNNRNVRGGSSKSMHAYGRAIDIGASPGTMQAVADYLRTIQGVQYVIYNHRISGPGANKPWRAYNPGPGGSPHTDHVHVDFLSSFQGVTGNEPGKIYEVKPGDTLSGIAQKLNTTLKNIVAANPQIKDIDVIHPGDKIHFF